MEKLTAKQQLHNFPEDLHKSINKKMKEKIDCDNILLCGMGGSGISNAIVYDCLYPKSKFIKILRTPVFPEWAGKRTLAIISSYSGNTEESIAMYESAVAHKCKIIVITSGGKLMEYAKKKKHMIYELPQGMDPRHAIGYMAGYLFAIHRDVGGADVTEKIEKIIPKLRSFVRKLERSIANPAKSLSKKLMYKTTIVIYDKNVESSGLRWKSQISENAKFISIAEPLEFLRIPGRYPIDCSDLMTITITTDKKKAAEIKKYCSKNKIENESIVINPEKYILGLFRSIIYGDFVSVYMAELEKVDPRDVTPITNLKAKMKSRL